MDCWFQRIAGLVCVGRLRPLACETRGFCGGGLFIICFILRRRNSPALNWRSFRTSTKGKALRAKAGERAGRVVSRSARRPPQCPERRRGSARVSWLVGLVVGGDRKSDGRLLLEFGEAEMVAQPVVGCAAGDHAAWVVVGGG